jgi:hypothetical protein
VHALAHHDAACAAMAAVVVIVAAVSHRMLTWAWQSCVGSLKQSTLQAALEIHCQKPRKSAASEGSALDGHSQDPERELLAGAPMPLILHLDPLKDGGHSTSIVARHLRLWLKCALAVP